MSLVGDYLSNTHIPMFSCSISSQMPRIYWASVFSALVTFVVQISIGQQHAIQSRSETSIT